MVLMRARAARICCWRLAASSTATESELPARVRIWRPVDTHSGRLIILARWLFLPGRHPGPQRGQALAGEVVEGGRAAADGNEDRQRRARHFGPRARRPVGVGGPEG